jgi:hypothetical protein
MLGADLTPFFVPGEFAGEGDTLAGAPVTGIFDGAYVRTNQGIGMASTHPVYTVPAVALPADPLGLVLYVGSENASFTVAEQEPDGTGVVVLILEKA